MVQTLEYPWNGVVTTGPLPHGQLGQFIDAPIRGIGRVRVLLDPRVVMPLGGTDPLPNISTIVYGAPLDTNQSRNARTIIQRCYDRSALGDDTRRRRAAVLSIACALGESILYVYANSVVPESLVAYHEQVGSNGYSVGLFQQQVGVGFQYPASQAAYVMDPVNSTNLWLDRLSAQSNWWVDTGAAAAGDLIQAAQQSGAGADVLYESFMDEAEAIVTEVEFPPEQPPSVGGGVIPASIQTALVEIANGAQLASPYPVDVGIEWCLNASQWPTSATAGRRPTVADLVTFWTAMNDVVGSHAGTWGFSLLNNPTFADTATANADPHASMTAYASVTWNGGTDPTTSLHQTACRWLEALTTQVVSDLRADGFTKNIAVPTMYAPGHLRTIAQFHPGGPWINDSLVWFETSFYPAALDETQIKSSYATYNSWASGIDPAYRTSWNESAYFTAGVSVIDPEVLPSPPQESLPPDPNGAPDTAPVAPVALSVTASDASARIFWTAPSYDGGSPVTGYEVTLVSTEGVRVVPVNDPRAVAVTVALLTNGVEYSLTVLAKNAVGRSPESDALLVTPEAGLPPVDPPPPPPPPTVYVKLEPHYKAFYEDQPFAPWSWVMSRSDL